MDGWYVKIRVLEQRGNQTEQTSQQIRLTAHESAACIRRNLSEGVLILGTYFSLLYSEICRETNSLIFPVSDHMHNSHMMTDLITRTGDIAPVLWENAYLQVGLKATPKKKCT